MYKIIFIDGGESGKRVVRLTDAIRNVIPKEVLTIHRSVSRMNENGVYHPLKGYDIAFIHNSDNVDEKLEPVFTIDAKTNNIPLVLYSGGMRGFRMLGEIICEINDSLLLEKVIPFLESHLSRGFEKINFNFLFPGEIFLTLEIMFTLRKDIIKYHELKEYSKSEEMIKEIFNNFEQLDLIGKSKKSPLVYPSDFVEILSEINKYILKFERKLNF